jgi:CRISPR/Cas system CSM-associated protein Csm3 (group 7 of RAMP superfamily)
MARPITSRWIIAGRFWSTEPLHVGGGAADGLDATPFRDGSGHFVVPGTAIAGVLRAHLAISGHQKLETMFGDADTKGASHLVVDDIRLTPATVRLELRDGVGIERISGAAAEGFKFDRQVLCPGASGDFSARLDWPLEPCEANKAIIASIISALESRSLSIGSGTTRGLGGFTIEQLSVVEFDLKTPRGILALASRSPGTPVERPVPAETVAATEAGQDLMIEIEWRPTQPIAVAHPHPGGVLDQWPLTTTVLTPNHQGEPTVDLLIPATSIKGAVRNRLEHIVRTALGMQEVEPDFLRQIHISGPVNDLFGSAPRVESRNGDGDGDEEVSWSPGARGALSFSDCTGKLRTKDGAEISQTDWRSITDWSPERNPRSEALGESLDGLKAERAELGKKKRRTDEEKARLKRLREEVDRLTTSVESELANQIVTLTKKLHDAGLTYMRPFQHVALDRLSSGPAAGKLFSRLEVLPDDLLKWELIRIRFNRSHLARREDGEDRTRAALALVVLMLDEMAAGNIPLGSDTNRGWGTWTVESICISGSALREPITWDPGCGSVIKWVSENLFSEKSPGLGKWEDIQEAWTRCLRPTETETDSTPETSGCDRQETTDGE